jgi:hypothetical protein
MKKPSISGEQIVGWRCARVGTSFHFKHGTSASLLEPNTKVTLHRNRENRKSKEEKMSWF